MRILPHHVCKHVLCMPEPFPCTLSWWRQLRVCPDHTCGHLGCHNPAGPALHHSSNSPSPACRQHMTSTESLPAAIHNPAGSIHPFHHSRSSPESAPTLPALVRGATTQQEVHCQCFAVAASSKNGRESADTSPALICSATAQQEVHVDGQLLALPVGPVLCLLHHRHLGGQLRKHHAAGCAEVQAGACTSTQPGCGLACKPERGGRSETTCQAHPKSASKRFTYA